MEKEIADRTIEEYFHKIYGFAVKKAYSMEEAQELCAEMVKEVYTSFVRIPEIFNIEGFVWRICENTYAKYVSVKKKKQGISLDGMILPYYDEYDLGEAEEELLRLRREIAFLTGKRRQIVYSFYYEGKSVSQISAETGIPEGTVKWHLNRARNDLKEGIDMDRKIGKLGLAPIEAMGIGHNGKPGSDGGPERFLQDKLNLNIVYSVYWTPRTPEEIAEELGMTPVFLEEKINLLEANGFLVRTTENRYTTYVKFSPRTFSIQEGEEILKVKLQAAKKLAESYVPKVRSAIADYANVYIPDGNRELFEAAVICYAIAEKCEIPLQRDLSKYWIRTLNGGVYIASVNLKPEISDPEYVPALTEMSKDYQFCGAMTRDSGKYPVASWSIDSRFCSRKGGWENNRSEDYEYLYEVMTGAIREEASSAEKYARLREREFLDGDGRVNVMVVGEEPEKFFARIPELDREIRDEFAGFALEKAMLLAKGYPGQMQDLVVAEFVRGFIAQAGAMMVLDILYDSGTFRPLAEREKAASQLLMFCDRLPE